MMSYRFLTIAGLALVGSSVVTLPAKAQGLLDLGRAFIGLPAEDKPPIEYRERAPLVVPPGQNLRQPSRAGAPDERRANWPQDPDVLARRKAAEQANKQPLFDTVTSRSGQVTRPLTPQEIRAGRVAGQEVNTTPQTGLLDERSRANVYGGITTLRELDKKSASTAVVDAREEPKREYLTDPPTGLRRPADNAPFKATREGALGAQQAPSPFDIFKEGPNTR